MEDSLRAHDSSFAFDIQNRNNFLAAQSAALTGIYQRDGCSDNRRYHLGEGMAKQKSKVWAIVRVASGNFLEMYDFMVFGYAAPYAADYP